MKILIFTENNRSGGMDTFIVNLINYWPSKEDRFTIICNNNHPGLEYLDKNLSNKKIKCFPNKPDAPVNPIYCIKTNFLFDLFQNFLTF